MIFKVWLTEMLTSSAEVENDDFDNSFKEIWILVPFTLLTMSASVWKSKVVGRQLICHTLKSRTLGLNICTNAAV